MVSFLASLVLLLAAAADARVFDSLSRPPLGWRLARDALPTERLTLRIALRQQRPEELEQAVLDVSNPDHARYGRHLTRDEVRSYTDPGPRAVGEVSRWLSANGVADYEVDHDWVTFNSTVAVVNRMKRVVVVANVNRMMKIVVGVSEMMMIVVLVPALVLALISDLALVVVGSMVVRLVAVVPLAIGKSHGSCQIKEAC
jgi:hypothetical protein